MAASGQDRFDVIIIGAGLSGMYQLHLLRKLGFSVRVVDAAGDLGGVWYWNRYPGAMCDTAAMVYLPLLEETAYLPSKKYVFGPEIFAHAKRIATTFGLYDDAVFSTQVTSLTWDDDASRWIIRTNRGDEPPPAPDSRREFTNVERNVLRRLMAIFTDGMTAAWAPVLPFRPEVARFETDPRLAVIAPVTEAAVLCAFELDGGIARRAADARHHHHPHRNQFDDQPHRRHQHLHRPGQGR